MTNRLVLHHRILEEFGGKGVVRQPGDTRLHYTLAGKFLTEHSVRALSAWTIANTLNLERGRGRP